MGQDGPELGALRGVGGDFVPLVGGKVGGAPIDPASSADAEPLAPLGAGLCGERLAFRALDSCLGEHGVTEETTAARVDAGQRFAVIDHSGKARAVTDAPSDQQNVTAADLVEGN